MAEKTTETSAMSPVFVLNSYISRLSAMEFFLKTPVK